MDATTFATMVEKYGWGAVLLLWIAEKSAPVISRFFSRVVFPSRVKAEQAKIEQEKQILSAKLEAERLETEARIKEREWRHEIDERQIRAFEKLVELNSNQTQLLTVLNERQSQLIMNTSQLSTYVMGAVQDMKEQVREFHPQKPKGKIS